MNIFREAFTSKPKQEEPFKPLTSSGGMFSQHNQVVETKENTSKNIYNFGKKNDFPEEIIELYERSAVNQAVVNRKSLMIAGNGIDTTDFNVESLAFVNQLEDKNVLRSLAMNYTLFNSMALCVVWSLDGQRIVSFDVVRSNQIRKSLNGGFYICEDWSNTNKNEVEYIQEFNLQERKGKQLMFFEREQINNTKYPIPTWYSASNWINIDIEISNEYLSSLENGFSPRVIVEFMQSPQKDEQKDEIMRNLERAYQGSKGKKVMGLFSPKREMKTEITPINVDNIQEQYQVIVEHSQAQILTAHGVTSPMLMGIKTAGQLGGASELEISYNIFLKSVIRPDQKHIEKMINKIAKINELNEVTILEYPIL